MNGKNIGMAMGLIIGIIISLFVIKAFNKDGKMKTKYDEMQELVRGRAYKYAFWILLIYEALLIIADCCNLDLRSSNYLLQFIGIIIAVMVHAIYSIWNDAYIGLNTNPKRFAIISVLIALLNLAIGIGSITRVGLLENGMVRDSFANLLCGICFLVIAIVLFIKHKQDIAEESEEV